MSGIEKEDRKHKQKDTMNADEKEQEVQREEARQARCLEERWKMHASNKREK